MKFKAMNKDLIWEYFDLELYHHYHYSIIQHTICPFTGLFDKNRTPIYAGDILIDRNGKRSIIKYGIKNCECCEGVYGWYLECGDIRVVQDYEVVENIFDKDLKTSYICDKYYHYIGKEQ